MDLTKNVFCCIGLRSVESFISLKCESVENSIIHRKLHYSGVGSTRGNKKQYLVSSRRLNVTACLFWNYLSALMF